MVRLYVGRIRYINNGNVFIKMILSLLHQVRNDEKKYED